jgi:hypothetical protein
MSHAIPAGKWQLCLTDSGRSILAHMVKNSPSPFNRGYLRNPELHYRIHKSLGSRPPEFTSSCYQINLNIIFPPMPKRSKQWSPPFRLSHQNAVGSRISHVPISPCLLHILHKHSFFFCPTMFGDKVKLFNFIHSPVTSTFLRPVILLSSRSPYLHSSLRITGVLGALGIMSTVYLLTWLLKKIL